MTTFGSGISFSGLGSGIDSAALIERLVQLEGLRKAQYESKKQTAQSKQSAFGKLKELVNGLKAQAKGLSESGRFLQLAGSASREGVIGFDVASNASQGTHTIEVLQTAATDRWAFDAVTDPDADLGAGAVSFQIGGTSYSVAIDGAASTIDEIAAAINTQAGEAVEASVVNVGTTSAPSWRLVVASKQSGEAGRLHGLTSTVAGLAIDGTEPASGATDPVSANNLVVGVNAQALVDGLLVERDTNEFSGVIVGVTFTAHTAAPGEPVDLAIAPDGDAIKTSLKSFVEAYNKLVSYMNQQSTYSEDDGAGGALFGDSAMAMVRRQVRSALFDVNLSDVMADTEGYSTLSLVGLNVQKDGTIVVDETKLDQKIADNVNALADLFADDDGFDDGGLQPGDPGYGQDFSADSGLAAKLVRAIEAMTDRATGPNGEALQSIFSSKDDALQKTISELDKRIEDEQFRLDKFEEQLRLRFAKLEDLMGGLNAQSAALQALVSGS